jgi:hypothetical protein
VNPLWWQVKDRVPLHEDDDVDCLPATSACRLTHRCGACRNMGRFAVLLPLGVPVHCESHGARGRRWRLVLRFRGRSSSSSTSDILLRLLTPGATLGGSLVGSSSVSGLFGGRQTGSRPLRAASTTIWPPRVVCPDICHGWPTNSRGGRPCHICLRSREPTRVAWNPTRRADWKPTGHRR